MVDTQKNLSVREIQETDFKKIVDYFLTAERQFLLGMGVDPAKLPARAAWMDLLAEEYQKPLADKKFYYVIWQLNGSVVGHSNINKIIFGEEAYMHLHMWQGDNR